jgi:hypothetical protein
MQMHDGRRKPSAKENSTLTRQSLLHLGGGHFEREQQAVTTIHQLNPPLWLETPRGQALAHLVIDYGIEHDLLWITFLQVGGQCWAFRNPEIRASENVTLGRTKPE